MNANVSPREILASNLRRLSIRELRLYIDVFRAAGSAVVSVESQPRFRPFENGVLCEEIDRGLSALDSSLDAAIKEMRSRTPTTEEEALDYASVVIRPEIDSDLDEAERLFEDLLVRRRSWERHQPGPSAAGEAQTPGPGSNVGKTGSAAAPVLPHPKPSVVPASQGGLVEAGTLSKRLVPFADAMTRACSVLKLLTMVGRGIDADGGGGVELLAGEERARLVGVLADLDDLIKEMHREAAA